MEKHDCIFCRIIDGKLPAKVITQNDKVIVIEDIAPKAPIHYLIITKKHVSDLKSIDSSNKEDILECLLMAQNISKNILAGKGFNLISNNGADAGQIVFHMHWHYLSGRNLGKVMHEL